MELLRRIGRFNGYAALNNRIGFERRRGSHLQKLPKHTNVYGSRKNRTSLASQVNFDFLVARTRILGHSFVLKRA